MDAKRRNEVRRYLTTDQSPLLAAEVERLLAADAMLDEALALLDQIDREDGWTINKESAESLSVFLARHDVAARLRKETK